jgi:hypothetical protein
MRGDREKLQSSIPVPGWDSGNLRMEAEFENSS